ncbi:MAG: McrC family protein [Bdellovibrionia bacterium]
MKPKLSFFEYSGFESDSGRVTDSILESGFNSAELKYLDWFSKTRSPNSPVFQITQSSIRAQQYVGSIRLGGKEIEILPKLLRSQDSEEKTLLLQNLLVMLEYVNQIDGLDAGVFKLSQQTGSFFEIYIYIFAKRLLRLLQRGPARAYVLQADNLSCLKGKINFTEDIRKNALNRSRVFCEFDEFTLDNIYNQTFKYLANTLVHVSRLSETKKLLARAVSLLSEAKDRSVSYDDVKHLQVTDRAKELGVVFQLAKMFLRYLRADLFGGRSEAIALLIDMNQLFEDFVFQLLNKNKKRLNITKVDFQKGRRLVRGVRDIGETEFDNKTMFNTYQDIVVDFSSGKRLVIDTKYKLLQREHNAHMGISNNDVYQILTYRELNADLKDTTVALFYPEYLDSIKMEFKVNSEADIRFAVATINFGVDMRSDLNDIVTEVERVFDGLGLNK